MKGFAKFVILIVAVLCVEMATVAGAGFYALTREGFIDVDVHQNGQHLSFPVPASIIRHASVHVSTERGCKLDMQRVMAAAAEIEHAPDFTLLDSRDGNQHVMIFKSGSQMHLDVTQPGQHLRVTIPTRALGLVSGT